MLPGLPAYVSAECLEGTLHLWGPKNAKQGTVMVCHEGSFGSVCDNGWDDNDAKVVCRMLGYPAEGNGKISFSLVQLFSPPSL